jgi:hypothetical protein
MTYHTFFFFRYLDAECLAHVQDAMAQCRHEMDALRKEFEGVSSHDVDKGRGAAGYAKPVATRQNLELLELHMELSVTKAELQLSLGQLEHVEMEVQYGAEQCRTVQYSTVQYSAVQYSEVQYSAVQCSTVPCSTVQCSTVQYSTVRVVR